MKKIFNLIIPGILLLSGVISLFSLSGCKRDALVYSTTGDVNMYSYLNGRPEEFSMFQEIVEKAGYASFLDTYGAYTLFASNNAGVTAYLQAQGKTSVDQIDEATAKNIVAVSLVANDTIASNRFTDGKMRSPTTAGQYLITGVKSVNSTSTITINKQANLVRSNVRVGNGIIHVIDDVLIPAPYTIAQVIASNPEYSIFRAALHLTGFYDTLNVIPASNLRADRKYLTLIAQKDEVFHAAGIADSAALRAKLSTKGAPRDHTDSLWLFVAHRIWSELSYVSDIASSTLHRTLAPDQQTTSAIKGTTVLLNYDFINGIQEPGQELLRPISDITARNGVVHSVATHYKILIRPAAPVYFDVAMQPEIMRTPGLYKVPGKSQDFREGQLANALILGRNNAYFGYRTDSQNPVNYYFNNDWMQGGIRFRTGTNALNAIEFTTPIITAGRYKIWVDYKRSHNQTVIASFDGEVLPNIFNPGDALLATETEAQAEARGYKSYSESPNPDGNGHVGRLLGTVNIKTTGPHKIRLTATACSGCAVQLWLDAFEFRPVDMNQLRPKLGRDGSLIP